MTATAPQSSVVRLRLFVSNAYLVCGTRPILVDTGSPGEHGRIERLLQRYGVELADLALILHTHGHWDHAGSTAALAAQTRAPVAVHAADAEMLRRGRGRPLTPTKLTGWLLMPFLDRGFPSSQPTLLVDETTSLHEYGVPGRLLHTPGHTAGSVTLLLNDGVAIAGDTLVGGYLAGALFPGRPCFHFGVEDLAATKASLRKLTTCGAHTLYVGHGGPLRMEAVARWVERVVTS